MSGMNRIERLKLFLQGDPEDAFLNYALAMEYIALRETELAEQLLNKIWVSNPEYIPVYYQLGKLNALKGNIQKAIEIYRNGIEKCKLAKDQKTAAELNAAMEDIIDE